MAWSRTHTILGGLLLLQLVLIAAFQLTGPDTGATESRPLIPDLETLAPARLQIVDPEGEEVNLARDEDGWGLREADGYPVPGDKIRDLLDDLEGLDVRRPVVTKARYHDSLKVGEEAYERRLRLYGEDAEEPEVDLFLGSSSNYRVTHVRLDGDDRVYEVSGLAPYDVRATKSAWIDTKFVDVPVDQVTAVKLTNSKGSFELRKSEDGWTVAAPSAEGSVDLDEDEVDGLLRSAGSVWIAGPVGRLDEDAHGLASPAAVVELTVTEPPPAPAEEPEDEQPETEGAAGDAEDARSDPSEAPVPESDSPESEGGVDGESEEQTPASPAEPVVRTEILRVGATVEGEEEQRYVARSGFDYVAAVRESSVRKLLDTALADLEPEADEEDQ